MFHNERPHSGQTVDLSRVCRAAMLAIPIWRCRGTSQRTVETKPGNSECLRAEKKGETGG